MLNETKLPDKQLNQLQAWKAFYHEKSSANPATIAAMQVGGSTLGLYQAGERGWLKFFEIGRDRWYSRKSVPGILMKQKSGRN